MSETKVSRQAERLGAQFLILDENIEVVDVDQLCEAPQFAAVVEDRAPLPG